MKKLFIILLAVLPLFAFVVLEEKNKATVNQIRGYYIFTDCKPVAPYDYLGEVKISVTWSGTYDEVRNKLITKAKKDFPNGDGLLFQFGTGSSERCEVIKFK